jgi:hypothetical protein
MEEKHMHRFGGGNLREGDHLEDPGIDKRITLRWTRRGMGEQTGSM